MQRSAWGLHFCVLLARDTTQKPGRLSIKRQRARTLRPAGVRRHVAQTRRNRP